MQSDYLILWSVERLCDRDESALHVSIERGLLSVAALQREFSNEGDGGQHLRISRSVAVCLHLTKYFRFIYTWVRLSSKSFDLLRLALIRTDYFWAHYVCNCPLSYQIARSSHRKQLVDRNQDYKPIKNPSDQLTDANPKFIILRKINP